MRSSKSCAFLFAAALLLGDRAAAQPSVDARVLLEVEADNKVLESRIRGAMTEALRKIGDVRLVAAADTPFFGVHVYIVDLKNSDGNVGWTASYAMTTFTRVGGSDLVVEEYSGSGVVYADYTEDHTKQAAVSIVEHLDSGILLPWRSVVANRKKAHPK